MCSFVLGVLIAHSQYRQGWIENHTRHPRYITDVLQKLFKEELEWLQQLNIITPLGMDDTAEWCNSFVLVPKLNGKVRLC